MSDRIAGELHSLESAGEGRHPGVAQILRFFATEHLPEHLQRVSVDFRYLALRLVRALPDGPELTTALRKLLEAKDCAVRARLVADDH